MLWRQGSSSNPTSITIPQEMEGLQHLQSFTDVLAVAHKHKNCSYMFSLILQGTFSLWKKIRYGLYQQNERMTTCDNFRNQLVQELQPLTPHKSVEDCNKGENTSFKGGGQPSLYINIVEPDLDKTSLAGKQAANSFYFLLLISAHIWLILFVTITSERASNQIHKLIKIHTNSQGLPTNWKKLWWSSSYKKQQYQLAISQPTSDQQRACLALSTASNKQGTKKHCWMKKVFKTKKLRCPFPTPVHTWRHQDKKLRYPFPTLVRTWRLQEQDASTLFSTLVRTPRVWTMLTTIV